MNHPSLRSISLPQSTVPFKINAQISPEDQVAASRGTGFEILQQCNNLARVIRVTRFHETKANSVIWNEIATFWRDQYHGCQLRKSVQQWQASPGKIECNMPRDVSN